MEAQQTQGPVDRWQPWLARGPWLVLALGALGVALRLLGSIGQLLDALEAGAADIPIRGWVASTVGQALIDAALVAFLALALRVLLVGLPTLQGLRDAVAGGEEAAGVGEGDGGPGP